MYYTPIDGTVTHCLKVISPGWTDLFLCVRDRAEPAMIAAHIRPRRCQKRKRTRQTAYTGSHDTVRFGPGLYQGWFAGRQAWDPWGGKTTKDFNIYFKSGKDTVLAAQFSLDISSTPKSSNPSCYPQIDKVNEEMGFGNLWDWDRVKDTPLYAVLIPTAYKLANLQGVNSGQILPGAFTKYIGEVSVSAMRVSDQIDKKFVKSRYSTEGCKKGCGRFIAEYRFTYQIKVDAGNLKLGVFGFDMIDLTGGKGKWEDVGSTVITLTGACCPTRKSKGN